MPKVEPKHCFPLAAPQSPPVETGSVEVDEAAELEADAVPVPEEDAVPVPEEEPEDERVLDDDDDDDDDPLRVDDPELEVPVREEVLVRDELPLLLVPVRELELDVPVREELLVLVLVLLRVDEEEEVLPDEVPMLEEEVMLDAELPQVPYLDWQLVPQ